MKIWHKFPQSDTSYKLGVSNEKEDDVFELELIQNDNLMWNIKGIHMNLWGENEPLIGREFDSEYTTDHDAIDAVSDLIDGR